MSYLFIKKRSDLFSVKKRKTILICHLSHSGLCAGSALSSLLRAPDLHVFIVLDDESCQQFLTLWNPINPRVTCCSGPEPKTQFIWACYPQHMQLCKLNRDIMWTCQYFHQLSPMSDRAGLLEYWVYVKYCLQSERTKNQSFLLCKCILQLIKAYWKIIEQILCNQLQITIYSLCLWSKFLPFSSQR